MFQFADNFEWLYPWTQIPDDYMILRNEDALTNWDHETGELLSLASDTLNAERKRELPHGHILQGLDIKAISLNQLTHKDFLFTTNDASRRLPVFISRLQRNWSHRGR